MSTQTGLRVGIFGAGKSGVAIARRAIAAGHQAHIATSGPADRTSLITTILTTGAVAVEAADLAARSDVVVLAVPLRRYRELPLDTLAGKVVIDVMNYWPPVDGTLPAFEDTASTSSEVVREALPASASLVKTFNHIGYHEIEELARPAGSQGRVALGVAGDDPGTVSTVARLVDDLGFDTVPAGPLSAGAALQPGSPLFGADLDATALRRGLTDARAESTL